jgi:AraC family transcriptional regulator
MSAEHMIPLSSGAWSGLPLFQYRHDEHERLLDFQVPVPLLVLWNQGHTRVDVHRTARQHWHFQGQAHHFDLYAAGRFKAITTSGDPSDKLIVSFPPELTASLAKDDVDNDASAGLEHCHFQFPDRMLEQLVRALAQHARDREPLGALYTRSLSAAVLRRLGSARPRTAPDGEARLQAKTQALLSELIDSRLAKPPDVRDLARLAGLRTSEFLKAFRRSFGSTPHQYLLERRIERAKGLLGLDRPLIAIALELGFASHAHFSASFHARVGCTPTEFRDQLRRAVVAAEPEADNLDSRAANSVLFRIAAK